MGLSGSCPLAVHLDLDSGFDSVLKSIGVKTDRDKSLVRSISLKLKHPDPVRIKHEEDHASSAELAAVLSSSPKDEAAVKLQKVYKSFRTRRKLADCAVLIERSWWKLLDFAELKHSSISFFEVDKHETALSRWSRARTRAAKVGKGLSENGKAQKLALQHWLEAIDPRHRYGHNLHFYYMEWLNSQSKEPFFYWLDIGEGKEVSLSEKCTRLKLQQQCIKYLGPMERSAYEVVVEDGKLFYKESGELLNTPDEPKGCKWIFVLSTSRTLYVAKKVKGLFQHSSFLAGGATLAAGRIVAEDGVLKAVWPHSGHYRPTLENFQDFLSFLRDNVVDLTDVKLDSTDDKEDSSSSDGKHVRRNSSGNYLITEEKEVDKHVRRNSSGSYMITEKEADKIQGLSPSEKAITISSIDEEKVENADEIMMRKLKSLKIPKKEEIMIDGLKIENKNAESRAIYSPLDDRFLTALDPFGETEEEETIPEEYILKRINSHKGMKSFQLGRQLSCKWSTGAGPRIGCVRDYPSGLQSHALEQVHLSPRSKCRLRLEFGARVSTPTGSNLSRSVRGSDYPQSD